MAVDSWMPIGYRFPDNVEIRQALFDGGDWQIYKSLNDLFILVVKERMFERWSKSNLVKREIFLKIDLNNKWFTIIFFTKI